MRAAFLVILSSIQTPYFTDTSKQRLRLYDLSKHIQLRNDRGRMELGSFGF
jgi:hypothetical protein